MTDLAIEFHATQLQALYDSDALKLAMGQEVASVLEIVPTDAAMPYVVVGEDEIPDDFEHDCGEEVEFFATVHIWSKPNPPQARQAREIAAAVVAALNLALVIDGWVIDEWSVSTRQYFTDPDGSTHVVLTFRYLATASGG